MVSNYRNLGTNQNIPLPWHIFHPSRKEKNNLYLYSNNYIVIHTKIEKEIKRENIQIDLIKMYLNVQKTVS